MTQDQWGDRRRRVFWLVVAMWLEAALISLYLRHVGLLDLQFKDPDDAMRLVQVRDFLAGQSWFDVTQYRSNPPIGAPMHWSRLVDLPIAALILLFRPLVGNHMAEVIACLSVPPLTLAALFWALYWATWRFLGRPLALVCCLLLATTPMILSQVLPLRIDHHAWQIVMAAFTLGGMLHPDVRKGGWISGLAMATSLHISGEGLPLAALFGGVMGLRYALRADEWPRFMGYMVALVGLSVVLLLAVHGETHWLSTYCDSMSPVYFTPLAAATAATMMVRQGAGDANFIRRAAALFGGGVAGAVLFVATAGPCITGPFAALDPLVYRFWYLDVMEGQPIWRQGSDMWGILLLPTLLGLVGFTLALRGETDARRRLDWLSLLLLGAGSLCVAITVLRASGSAQLLAIPGSAWVIARLYRPIPELQRMLARVSATVLLCVLSPAGLALAWLAIVQPQTEQNNKTDEEKKGGEYDIADVDRLAHVPKGVMFAPMDVGTFVLQRTPHSVISTAHHRNVAAMKTLIEGFLAPPDKARLIIGATPADYVLIVPGLGETGGYRKDSPHGLTAELIAGRVPAWLHPVTVPGMKTMQLYRIDRSAPALRPR